MKILAIDTSQTMMTACYYDGAHNLLETAEGQKNHAALLLPAIDRLLKTAAVTIRGIEAFCLVTGPGSFTGLRVGLSTLKGLGFGRRVPYIAVNSHELAAYYETKNAAEFYRVLAQKISQNQFTEDSEVRLHYEDIQTKRFPY